MLWCKFRLFLILKVDYAYWVVENKDGHGFHNHQLMLYPEGHRQVSGLSPSAKKVVGELSSSHVKPRHIMKAVNGAYPSLNPNMRHIYNCRHVLRKARSEGRNAAQQFLHQAIQSKYLFWIHSDAMGRVTHTFIAHPTSVKIVRTYPHVIHIDATYKTNKYVYPLVEIVGVTPTNKNFLIAWALLQHEDAERYRWMLERLKNLIGMSVTPNAIVTDRDLAVMKYIADVFPNSAHLLCTWHINHDVQAWVAKKSGGNKKLGIRFDRGAWVRVMNSKTVDEFTINVNNMIEEWGELGKKAIEVEGEGTKLKGKQEVVVEDEMKDLKFDVAQLRSEVPTYSRPLVGGSTLLVQQVVISLLDRPKVVANPLGRSTCHHPLAGDSIWIIFHILIDFHWPSKNT